MSDMPNNYFFLQEIAKASNEAARKYMEEKPKGERSDSRVIAAMRATAKSKVQAYKDKFSKYTAITNPRLGDEFL